MRRKPEPLIPDGDEWHRVARQAKPLDRANAPTPPLAPLPKVFRPEGPGKAASAGGRLPPEAAPRRPLRQDEAPEDLPQMDARLKRRLIRGELAIERRLDLHGHTLSQAERVLDKFLAEAIAAQCRCLLVITGKGSIARENLMPGQTARGVLRAWLPEHLRRGAHRRQILGISPAQIAHGGQGAFYILLRRLRGA